MTGNAFFASLPLVAVLALMLGARWSGARAGIVGLLLALLIGWARYGVTLPVALVSQVRGLALSAYILYIIWTALGLYHLVGEVGGVAGLQAVTAAWVPDRIAAALLYAWCLSGVLEGIAGFGVPLAVVAPMLITLGVSPLTAVAATAVGHAWSVTFGDMGVVYQALLSVSATPGGRITPAAAALMGGVCVASGWVVATMLGIRAGTTLVRVTAVGITMAAVQAALAFAGLAPVAAIGAGLAGMAVGFILLGVKTPTRSRPSSSTASLVPLAPYLLAALLLAIPSLFPGVTRALAGSTTAVTLPEVSTKLGWVTPAGTTKPIQWLLHPGSVMLLALGLTAVAAAKAGRLDGDAGRRVWRRTRGAAAPTSVGVTLMIGLAMAMDHAGMTQGLARAAGDAVGRAYPLLSGLVGLLGALATGSNTSSNVLFGALQEGMAGLLNLDPAWLLAAQTAGGALGSMVAPAKLVLGCAAVGLAGRESEVLRRTGPAAILLGMAVGAVALTLA